MKSILNNSISLFKNSFWKLFAIVSLFQLPSFFSFFIDLSTLSKPNVLVLYNFFSFVWCILLMGLMPVYVLLKVTLLQRIDTQKSSDWVSIWETCRSKLSRTYRVFLYAFAKIYAGSLMLIIPGLIWAFRFALTWIAAVVESETTNPLQLSQFMMARRGWRVIGMLTLAFFVSLGLTLAVCVVLAALPWFTFHKVTSFPLMQILPGMFVICWHYFLYFHYRQELDSEIQSQSFETPIPSWGSVGKWVALSAGLMGVWIFIFIKFL